MAGIFGFFDYNKPGPGVEKDAPPKSPFTVFFEILQRKFFNLIKVNLMFFLFNIPALILGMIVMLMFFPNIIPNATANSESLISDTLLKFILLTLIMCVPMVTVGPAQAGFTYIMRNYARQEHAFLWSDFKETALKNMKQSIIISTINFIATFLMLFVINAYGILVKAGQLQAVIGTILMTLMVLMFIIFAMMNLYIYPIMITFKLGIKQIYKNAMIFSLIRFLPNLGILLLSAFIILLSFGQIVLFNPIIGFILYIFLTISFIGFLTNFYAYPKLKKFMIAPIEENEEDEEDEDEEDDAEEEESNNEAKGDDEQQDGEQTDSETNGTSGDSNEIKRYF